MCLSVYKYGERDRWRWRGRERKRVDWVEEMKLLKEKIRRRN